MQYRLFSAASLARRLPFILFVFVAACGGSEVTTTPTNVNPVPARNAPSLQSGRIAITFDVPGASTTAAHRFLRNPKYVSLSTYQAVFVITPLNGQTLPPQIVVCQTQGAQGGVCGGALSAPSGVDTLAITLEDKPTGNNLQGNALSEGTVVAVVQPNTTTSIRATLDGVVHSVSLAFAAPSLTYIASTSADLTIVPTYVAVNALDADGNVITYNGAYLDGNGNPFGLTVNLSLSPSLVGNSVTPLTSTISGPGEIIPVSAALSGMSAPSTETLSATGNVFVGDPTIAIAPATMALNRYTQVGFPGNVYVADSGNHAVEELTAVNGVIYNQAAVTTLSSSFGKPFGVAIDGMGDVFVADPNHGVVNELLAIGGVVPSTPTILTIGSGFEAPGGVAVDAAGDVFVVDTNAVKEVVAVNGAVPPNPTIRSLGSGYSNPFGIAVDAYGNVYVSDTGNQAIKEIAAVSGVIPNNPTVSTIASGVSALGIAVDTSENVYLAEGTDVQEIVAQSGSIPANPTINTLSTSFTGATGVTVNTQGDVYVADQGASVIDELVASNGAIPANPTIRSIGSGFSGPFGVAVR